MSKQKTPDSGLPLGHEDAIALAVEAHRGVLDKSGLPYILHPLRVMFRCETEIERIVAVLHDLVEDTGRSFDDLRKLGYSEDVIAALDCVTKRDGENYEQFVERAATDPVAIKVKIADIEDNMDVRRLVSFGSNDLERMTKYLTAWRKLKGIDEIEPPAVVIKGNSSDLFTQAMHRTYEEAVKLGYKPTYFLRMVGELGAVKAAKELVHNPQFSLGFTKLWELGRLDLSVEYLVLSSEWQKLFDMSDTQAARDKLTKLKFPLPD